MSDELRAAQAELVASLLDNRVPEGFDGNGIHATAAILRRKRNKSADRPAQRISIRAIVVRTMSRVYEWWRAIGSG